MPGDAEPQPGPELTMDRRDRRSSGPLLASSLRRRRPRRSRAPLLWGSFLLVVVVAAGIMYWIRVHSAPEAGASAGGPPPAAFADSSDMRTIGSDSAVTPLPPLDSSDVAVRSLASGLSPEPRVAEWLKVDDLVRRVVLAVTNVANGGNPTSRLGFLKPKGAFTVRVEDGRTAIDPASYQRYDGVTEAFVSLDAQRVARLYRRIQPLCDRAYEELGLPGGTFEDALSRAFGRLLSVRVPSGAVDVVPDGAVYKFADPDLEASSPAAKHLIRMGPANAGRVQEKLRELARAMGVQPSSP